MSCDVQLVTKQGKSTGGGCVLAPRGNMQGLEGLFGKIVMSLQQKEITDGKSIADGSRVETITVSNSPSAPSRPSPERKSTVSVAEGLGPGCVSNFCGVVGPGIEVEGEKMFKSKVYVAESSSVDDTVELEIKELCKSCPEIQENITILRIGPGRYLINDREVSIDVVTMEFTVASEHETPPSVVGADLIVRDGPLSQPFLDYVFNTGRNEDFEIPRGELEQRSAPLMRVAERLEIRYDEGVPYAPFDRVGAMNLARHEAWMRDDDARRRLELASKGMVQPFLNGNGPMAHPFLKGNGPAASAQQRFPQPPPSDFMGEMLNLEQENKPALDQKQRRRHLFPEVLAESDAATLPPFADQDSEDSENSQFNSGALSSIPEEMYETPK